MKESKDDSKLRRRIIRMFVTLVILMVLFFVGLAIFWRVMKKENGIAYEKMNFVFPSSVSFEKLTWDVPDISRGSADYVLLDWEWTGLAARKVNVPQFKIQGAEIYVSYSDTNTSSASEVPDIRIGKLDFSQVNVLYVNQKDSLELNIPELRLREAVAESNLEQLSFEQFFFNQFVVTYSSDSLHFSNDTLPLKLDAQNFSSENEGDSYALDQLALLFGDLDLNAEKIHFDPKDNNQVSLVLNPSSATIQDILWVYPEFEEIIHPDYPRNSTLTFDGGLSVGPDSLRFRAFEINLISETKASLNGLIDWSDASIPLDLMLSKVHTSRADLDAFLMPQSYNSMFLWPSRADGPVHIFGNAEKMAISAALNTPEGAIDVRSKIAIEEQSIYYDIGLESAQLAIDQIIDYLPLSIPDGALDFRVAGTVNDQEELDTLLVTLESNRLEIEGYSLTGIDFTYVSKNGFDSLFAVVTDSAANLVFKGDLIDLNRDTSAVRWEGRIKQLKPNLVDTSLTDWTLSALYEGGYYYGDFDYSRIEFGLSNPLFHWSKGDSTLVPDQFMSYEIEQAKNQLYWNAGNDAFVDAFYDGEIPLINPDNWREQLDSMPELRLQMAGNIDSVLIHQLSGYAVGASLEKLDLTHSVDSLLWNLDITLENAFDADNYIGNVAGSVAYQNRHFEGALRADEAHVKDFNLSGLNIEIDRNKEGVEWLLTLEDFNDLGSSRIGIVQENLDRGYRLALTDAETLEILGNLWEVRSNEGILLDEDFILNRGSLGLRQNKASLICQTDESGEVTFELDSLRLRSVTEFFTSDTLVNAWIYAKADFNVRSLETALILNFNEITVDSTVIGDWHAEGIYRNDSLGLRVNFDKGLKDSYAQIDYADGKADFEVRVIDFDLGVLNEGFLPGEVQLAGILSGDVTGRYTDDIYADGWLNIERGRVVLPGTETPYILKGDSLKFVNDHLELDNFRIYDENDRPLAVSGILNTFPSLYYDLTAESEAFVFINQKTGKSMQGNASADLDLHVKGDNEYFLAEGSARILPGSFFRYLVQEGITVVQSDRIVQFVSFDEPDSIRVEEEPEIISELDIKLAVDDSEIDIVLDPVTQEYVRTRMKGDLTLLKSKFGDPEIQGSLESNSGRAYVSLPVVPSVQMDIEKIRIDWSGKFDEPRLNFIGKEAFNTSLDGLSEFEGRQGLVPVDVLIILNDGTPENLDILLDLKTEDPDLSGYLSTIPEESRMAMATNLLLFGSISPNGKSGSSMALGATAAKLNEIAHRNLENTDLMFSMSNDKRYDENGEEQEAMRLNYSLRKGLFENRLYVSIGGDLGISTPESGGYRPPAHYIGNVQLSYRLSENGPWTLRGARTESYEGVIDGELTEYKLGVGFYRSYPTFWSIFKKRNPEPEAVRDEE